MTRPLFPDDEITRAAGLGRRTGGLERRPAPTAGAAGAAVDYAYAYIEDVNMTGSSLEQYDFTAGEAHGTSLQINGTTFGIEITETGVYVLQASIKFPGSTTEQFNAYVRLDWPGSGAGSLDPWQETVWGGLYGPPAGTSGTFTHYNMAPVTTVAVADVTSGPFPVFVGMNKGGSTNRLIDIGVWAMRIGDAHTS